MDFGSSTFKGSSGFSTAGGSTFAKQGQRMFDGPAPTALGGGLDSRGFASGGGSAATGAGPHKAGASISIVPRASGVEAQPSPRSRGSVSLKQAGNMLFASASDAAGGVGGTGGARGFAAVNSRVGNGSGGGAASAGSTARRPEAALLDESIETLFGDDGGGGSGAGAREMGRGGGSPKQGKPSSIASVEPPLFSPVAESQAVAGGRRSMTIDPGDDANRASPTGRGSRTLPQYWLTMDFCRTRCDGAVLALVSFVLRSVCGASL